MNSGFDFPEIPILPLGQFPTPVVRLALPRYAPFWVKDDGRTGSIYCGNKVRKFEYLLADARRRGKQTLIVGGDAQSHTVLACAKLGQASSFSVDAVVYHHHGMPSDSTDAMAILQSTGARVIEMRSFLGMIMMTRLRTILTGGTLVPLGGSTPLSTVGYIRAAFELQKQVQAGQLPMPKRIYVAFASGGTTAGLLIGLALAGSTTQVVAVQTIESVIANRRNLFQLVSRTLSFLKLSEVRAETVMDRLERIDDSCLGRGYRDVPKAVHDAMSAMSKQPVAIEAAFTAKALAVMLNDISRNGIEPVLFWNTHSRSNATGES